MHFFLLFVAVYGLYLNRYNFLVATGLIALDAQEKYYDYRGISHVHSVLSTGSGSPAEIVRAAQDQRMDFLIFTDLNLLEHDRPLQGYFNSVLVLEGGEYSYLDSRLVYYNRPPNQPPKGTGQAQIYFADQLSQFPRPAESGFFVLAHPFHSSYQWTGDYPKGLDGIEIVNLKSVLERAWSSRPIASIFSILTYPFNAHASLLRIYRDPEEEQALWDRLNQTRKTAGFLGTDATAKAILAPGFFLKFPSYDTAFSVASNHVLLKSELTGNLESDKRKLFEALREGQFYFSLDILGSPKGFWAEVRSKGKSHLIGSELKYSNDAQIVVHLPSVPRVPYEVRIIKDGELYATANAQDTVINLMAAGAYRVVVRILVPLPFPEGHRWIPWIYSNPIILGKN